MLLIKNISKEGIAMKKFFYVIILFLLLSTTQAGVIIGDAVLGPGWLDSDYELYLSQSIPTGMGLFTIWITQTDIENFTFYAAGIAERYSLHSAFDGLELTPGYIAEDIPLVATGSGLPPANIYIPLYDSIFLGYWDDREEDDIPSYMDSYGWIELMNSPDGLVIRDGATALGGGIIVGTYTQIPEPGTMALILLGGIGLFIKKRKSRK